MSKCLSHYIVGDVRSRSWAIHIPPQMEIDPDVHDLPHVEYEVVHGATTRGGDLYEVVHGATTRGGDLYEVVNGATTRGGDLLVSSTGYGYTRQADKRAGRKQRW